MKKWRVLMGLGVTLLALLLVVFVLRPNFLADYTQTIANSRLLFWDTPTVGGILAFTMGWNWSKLVGVAILPVAIAWWWLQRGRVDTRSLIDVTLLLSVITAPFGWGYDAIVLLLPLLQIIAWIADGRFSRLEAVGLILLLVLMDGVSFYQRSITVSEVYYFWLPLAIAGLYVWARVRLQAGLPVSEFVPV